MNSISSIVKHVSNSKLKTIRRRFQKLYGSTVADQLLERFSHILGRYGVGTDAHQSEGFWSEKDAVLITYADMVSLKGEVPLDTLRHFCGERL